jgi:hypothetical protein
MVEVMPAKAVREAVIWHGLLPVLTTMSSMTELVWVVLTGLMTTTTTAILSGKS